MGWQNKSFKDVNEHFLSWKLLLVVKIAGKNNEAMHKMRENNEIGGMQRKFGIKWLLTPFL